MRCFLFVAFSSDRISIEYYNFPTTGAVDLENVSLGKWLVVDPLSVSCESMRKSPGNGKYKQLPQRLFGDLELDGSGLMSTNFVKVREYF